MDYRDEMEIDLIDLLHYLLLKWRAVLASMLIGMIVLGVYGYYKKVPMVIDEKGEVVEAVDNSSLASLGSKISYNEKYEAVLAVENYLAFEKTYNDRITLGKKSITMQFDPFHVPTIVNTYKISDYNDDNVPLQSDVTIVDNIVALYQNALNDQSVISEIKKANSWEYDEGFIRELYSVNKMGLDIMTVSVNAPSEKECEAIMNVLDKTISSVSSDIMSQYEHNIAGVQSVYYEAYNSMVLDQQKTQNDNLINIEKTMQQIPNSMTADQKTYYYALLNAVKEESNDGESTDPRTIARKGLAEEENLPDSAIEADSTSVASDKASESEQNVVMVPGKKISIKYILLGALAGIFVVCCFYGMLYVLSPRIKTKDELQDVFGITVLGIMRDDSKYNRAFGGVDRFIDSLFEKKDRRLSAAEWMDMITSSILLGINKDALKNLYIVGTGSGKRLEDVKGNLKNDIENNSASERSCTIKTGASPLINSSSLKALSSADAVVLVEEIGTSRYDDIAKIKEVCEKLDVKILGTVVLG